MTLVEERRFAAQSGVESGPDSRSAEWGVPPSPFDAEGLQFAWDSTSLQWAMDCLWKYKALMLDGWTTRRPSVHLIFGGLYASALEHFHKHLADGLSRDDALRKVVHEALCATWIDGKPWESDHNTTTRANLIRTIVWYVDHFDPDPVEVVTLRDGRPAVEYSFALEIDDCLIYSGDIDRLVNYGGDIYVQDQKTTASTVSAAYFRQFDPDVQMSGYAFAAQATLPQP